MSDLNALYKDIILEHSKDPRNFGPLPGAQLSREGYNPLCGDQIKLQVKLNSDGSLVEGCGFTGKGCAICLASASILIEESEGESVETVLGKILDFRSLMKGEKSPSDFEGDVEALAGVRQFPVRIKCALLAWAAMGDALQEYLDGKKDGNGSGFSKTE